MNKKFGIADAIKAKSDQMNAIDLIGGSVTYTIQGVTVERKEQPVSIFVDGAQPYKPSKGMIRVLSACWGLDEQQWIGRSLTLYRESSVKWAGKEEGGIRISHLSDIASAQKIPIPLNKKQREIITVNPLVVQTAFYDDQQFKSTFPAVTKHVLAGNMSPEQAIAKLEQTAPLTDHQRAAVLNITINQET